MDFLIQYEVFQVYGENLSAVGAADSAAAQLVRDLKPSNTLDRNLRLVWHTAGGLSVSEGAKIMTCCTHVSANVYKRNYTAPQKKPILSSFGRQV